MQMDDAGQNPSDTPDEELDNVVPMSGTIEIPDPFADVDDVAEPMADAVPLKPYRPRPGGSFIMAGMIGLANAMGMEDFRDEIEIAIPFENDQDGLNFDFGKLPPL